MFMAIRYVGVMQDGRIEGAKTRVKFPTLSCLLLPERNEHSATRMVLGMQQLEAFTRDVSVNLRGGNVSVTQ